MNTIKKSFLMKKVILTAIVATFLLTTSAVAGDFCEAPKWLKAGNTYLMLLGNGQKASGKVKGVDKKTCWIIVEDRTRVKKQGQGGPGDMVNVNIRQIVSAIEME